MTTLLIDTKDLIDLVERSSPMNPREFSCWANDRGIRVVLTFTNVSEFADILREDEDVLKVRSYLQEVEALPSVFLQESLIQVNELAKAIEAFNADDEPTPHNPFVGRWDQTFSKFGESSPAETVVNYRLDMMVVDLRGPDARRTTRKLEALAAIRADRAILKTERPSPRVGFTGALARMVEFWDLIPPSAGMEAFGKWVFADPARCPGLRLGWEVFHALVANESDALEDSDLWDNAHFPAIPYVDFATLDRRMTGYSRAASKKLGKLNPVCDYGSRIFRSLSEFIASSS